MTPYQPVTPAIAAALAAIVGVGHVIYAEPDLMLDYAHDETVGKPGSGHLPEAVVTPASAAEISGVMQLANREHVAVTPRGAGSGLSGGAVPVFGGIVLSFARMNHILEVDHDNLVVVTEPGVITNAINDAVQPHGLFYGGYPMSEEMCYIGGNVAENAGGGRAIKYGVTSRYVLGLEVVLPTGEIVQMGGKRVKDVTGYDLVHLMVGSEGTLGLITKIILRLQPLPTQRMVLLLPFADRRTAIAAVPQIMTRGRVVPAAIEFMDQRAVEHGYRLVGERPPRPGIGALLLVEIDGASPSQVDAEFNAVVDLCLELGALDAYVGDTPSKGKQMWLPRQKLAEGLTQLYPIQSSEDLVVPPAQIPDLLDQMDAYGAKHGLEYIAYGHAGDGNLHIRILKPADMPLEQWWASAKERTEDLYTRVTALGGTITAEHGIGNKLSQYLPLALDPTLIALQKRIKAAFDPNNILNPGKIFP